MGCHRLGSSLKMERRTRKFLLRTIRQAQGFQVQLADNFIKGDVTTCNRVVVRKSEKGESLRPDALLSSATAPRLDDAECRIRETAFWTCRHFFPGSRIGFMFLEIMLQQPDSIDLIRGACCSLKMALSSNHSILRIALEGCGVHGRITVRVQAE